MSIFKIHTKESVEREVSVLFVEKEKHLGFVPNIFAVIAESTPAAQAFDELSNYFDQCNFTDAEKETIEIVTSIENGCGYCVAGHTAFAETKRVPGHIIKSLRENQVVDNPRIEALAVFTRAMIRSRGKISQKELILFFDAGFTKTHLIEVVLGICLKFLTNLVSNSTSVPLDPAFEPYFWSENQEHGSHDGPKAQAI